ncbi:MAG: hypothetical protein M3Z08_01375 [Chloroflexota bacterium]|nr:hypothetical protein [Chloroflexota bacterium]
MQRFRTKNIWLVLQVITGALLIGYAIFVFFFLGSNRMPPVLFVIELALIVLYGLFDWRRRKNKAKNLL